MRDKRERRKDEGRKRKEIYIYIKNGGEGVRMND